MNAKIISVKIGLVLLAGLLCLLPLIWMVQASLIPPATPLPTRLQLWPQPASWANFGRIFALTDMTRFTLNSARVVAVAVPLTLITGSAAGFAITQLGRPAQRRWVLLSLAVLMIPGLALWSSRFLVYRTFGWLDTIWALVAPAWMGTSPFYVLMFYRAFRRLPPAQIDAARIDGADPMTLWWRVALPQIRPTTVGVAFLAFLLYWGDFVSPLLYAGTGRTQTLPVGLQLLQQLSRSDWPLLMAGAVWAALIPLGLLLLLLLWFRRSE